MTATDPELRFGSGQRAVDINQACSVLTDAYKERGGWLSQSRVLRDAVRELLEWADFCPVEVVVVDPPTGDPDAMAWAVSFVSYAKRNPQIVFDEGTMVGWFANAMCAAVDNTPDNKRRAREAVDSALNSR